MLLKGAPHPNGMQLAPVLLSPIVMVCAPTRNAVAESAIIVNPNQRIRRCGIRQSSREWGKATDPSAILRRHESLRKIDDPDASWRSGDFSSLTVSPDRL